MTLGPSAPPLALIFDMDGVIVDSNPTHRRAWELFNRRYGLETTEAMHQRMYGKHNADIVRDYFGPDLDDAEVAARGAAKEALYRELAGAGIEQMLVPGVRAFLEEHRARPMGVGSNAEPANVEFVLERSGLRPFFRTVVDGHQVRRPKPDPEVFLLVAERLGAAPANCIVFEDSPTGVQAALAAGMKVVGIRTTFGDLPGTSINVDNFLSGQLREWLVRQIPAD
ncbi:MAG TPA: beta-phosphoglucomutase family hydrolase [Bryobacteraceae bacterium]|nr:beta-phosphoglucomutase family hydrolase [Bryobacteraceae bacterium]